MAMMKEHANQVVWEYMTTKHDDQGESIQAKLGALLEAVNDYIGAPVTTGFNATISNQSVAPEKSRAKADG